ncbi:MAG: hypothetical protein JGK30_25690 [Microcoleus sp. PH2017_40_RAT_O_B]|uniref:hypothetical protein n=1 Tax=unclassified Microcoleus TaxID=2642155 RepID=UPI001E03F3E8|nr:MULTISPECIES: hypothetical protein [unclassified Microcoleus]MCC3435614.1 hypothetical protein [Microcoleus sp. PH2017_05_CCC_O_A]MCC3491597.1 hypothetical protein [Microcoleus sp. PH2017_16_JOR_D_A]MCC3572914.1 hypothetical protein [Microcoleus sp. PH2017_34_RAT_O_A]MCC3590206.1 hypothetical protein [Microcoleus sp. PH2017_28_MFU_U_A]MCC3612772.1 hypothetical protein [Microcoleus sp. PH2017_40_RAT_O_B]
MLSLARLPETIAKIPAIKVSPSIGGVFSETATAASILTRTASIDWRSVVPVEVISIVW